MKLVADSMTPVQNHLNTSVHYLHHRTESARWARRNLSYKNRELWQLIRRKQLGVRFVRERNIGPFRVDFYCAKPPLAIELDGPWHATPEGKNHDLREQKYLNDLGIDLLRFSIVRTHAQQMRDAIAIKLEGGQC